MRFKLLGGMYQCNKLDANGKPMIDEKGKNVNETYDCNVKGKDVVESNIDLARQYPGKFQRIESWQEAREQEEAAKASSDPNSQAGKDAAKRFENPEGYRDLNSMTIVELRKYADELNLDLGTATRKDEIVKSIETYLEELE